jgi:hypothetical protein
VADSGYRQTELQPAHKLFTDRTKILGMGHIGCTTIKGLRLKQSDDCGTFNLVVASTISDHDTWEMLSCEGYQQTVLQEKVSQHSNIRCRGRMVY